MDRKILALVLNCVSNVLLKYLSSKTLKDKCKGINEN